MLQGLSATDFVRTRGGAAGCFPFNVPHRLSFYRARNAIYHLFRALLETNPGPHRAGARLQQRQRDPGHARGGRPLRYYPIRRDMRLDPEEVERAAARTTLTCST